MALEAQRLERAFEAAVQSSRSWRFVMALHRFKYRLLHPVK